MPQKTIKIVIADDHEVVIDGLTALLLPEEDMQVVGRAVNGRQLVDMLKNKPVDIVIMDIEMPEMDGVEATAQLKKEHPGIKILVLTMYNTPEFIASLLRHGADGYILKNTRKRDLVEAIRKVAGGSTYFAPEVAGAVMESLRGGATTAGPATELTDREKEIVRLIAAEYTSREIADKLFISFHTVERHRKNIIAKLGVKNVAGLVKYALKNGLANGS